MLGQSVDDGATAEFAAIGLQDPPSARPHWMFLQVPEGKAAKNRMHADLIAGAAGATGLAAETERLLGLGAVTVHRTTHSRPNTVGKCIQEEKEPGERGRLT